MSTQLYSLKGNSAVFFFYHALPLAALQLQVYSFKLSGCQKINTKNYCWIRRSVSIPTTCRQANTQPLPSLAAEHINSNTENLTKQPKEFHELSKAYMLMKFISNRTKSNKISTEFGAKCFRFLMLPKKMFKQLIYIYLAQKATRIVFGRFCPCCNNASSQ